MWSYIQWLSHTTNIREHSASNNAVGEITTQLFKVKTGLHDRDSNDLFQLPFSYATEKEQELITRDFKPIHIRPFCYFK